ncbi:hypothetical protein J2Y67_005449 [Neobacillus niacini]|nr:hypothetical protein [Neobacillus niacini]
MHQQAVEYGFLHPNPKLHGREVIGLPLRKSDSAYLP